MKMISPIKICKQTKSVILVKSIIYKVNKVSSIVPANFSFLKTQNPQNTQKYTLKTKQQLFFSYICLL